MDAVEFKLQIKAYLSLVTIYTGKELMKEQIREEEDIMLTIFYVYDHEKYLFLNTFSILKNLVLFSKHNLLRFNILIR